MDRYASDVTDAQWIILEPLVTKTGRMGRPVELDLREIINALVYLNRTGCQWRMLPTDFPAWTSVRYYFDIWTEDSTLERINDTLRKAVRQSLGREEEPEKAVLDSQSVKTTEVGGERGVAGGKRVNGRKRHILVDTNGFLIRVLVSAANISDSEGGEWLLGQHAQCFGRLKIVRVDGGYKDCLIEWASRSTTIIIEVIEKPADQKGFAVIPLRWVVERTFAWLGRNRRLSKDYERLPKCSESWIVLGSIHLMLKRLACTT